MSIFGNIDSTEIRRLFIKVSTLVRTQESLNSNTTSLMTEVTKLLSQLINECIIHTTNNRCKVIIKHCNENSFSPSDATKFIDILKLEGHNVKCLMVDYIDVCN